MNLPNKLTVLRICMIPFFVAALLYENGADQTMRIIANVIFITASLTDLLDGKIARKFNMVTELGKLLDPVADKLTHGALALCLALRYPLMWALILLLIVKEGYMAVMGAVLLKKGKKLNGAMWFGKVCTALLFVVMFVLILVPHIPAAAANALIAVCAVVMAATLILYIPVFRKM